MANSFLSNQGTQSALITDNTGGASDTLIPVMKLSLDAAGTYTDANLFQGTILQVNTLGTLPNLPGGSINVTTGTVVSSVTSGTQQTLGTVGTIPGVGTITSIGSISNIGTMPSISANPSSGTLNTLGTLGTIQNILAGTIGTVTGVGVVTSVTNLVGGTLGILTNGTLSSSGTTTGVGVVSVLTKGTVSLGSVGGIDANAVAQTGNPISVGGTDSGGTVRTVLVDSTGAMKVNSVAVGTTIGTINVGTINTGTVNTGTINAGTINSGTINTGTFVMTAGTLSPIPTIANVTYGTHGTTGVSIFGTLAGGTGSGAGTEIFITSLSLTIPSTGGSQDASIGWGTNGGTFQAGTGLLVRGNFPPGGGIQKTFSPPVNSGTQAQLCLFQAGAGTVDVSITYFLATSSL